jgi:hypothetical protein
MAEKKIANRFQKRVRESEESGENKKSLFNLFLDGFDGVGLDCPGPQIARGATSSLLLL